MRLKKMNNEMIGNLSMAVKQLQDLTQGLIRVMRKLPDYENILAEITKMTSLVTISIGSGNAADAQFLFAEDILGQSQIQFPRHAKKYANFDKLMNDLQKERINAFKKFNSEVRKNKFPSKKNSISLEKKELMNFKKFLNNQKVTD